MNPPCIRESTLGQQYYMKCSLKLLVFWAGLVAWTALNTGCFRNDTRTLEVNVPGMRQEACAEIITNSLRSIAGIKKIEVNLASKKIIAVYDGLILGHKNVEQAIAHAGFDANEIPAKEDARKQLPEGCR